KRAESVPDRCERLRWRQESSSRGRKFDRQRKPLEALAELRDCGVWRQLSTRHKEVNGLDEGQGLHRVLDLTAHSKQLSACDQHAQVRASFEDVGELRPDFDDVLKI